MLRDITLGQYYPADSVIHKLDPRVKLSAAMIYIISLFCCKGIAAFFAATVFLITVIKLSKVPFQFMVKGLKAIVVLMLLTAVFNLFLTPGKPLVSFLIFTITEEGLKNAVFGGRAEALREKIEEINAMAAPIPAVVPETSEQVPKEKPRFFENPLPLPKKHVKREMDYDYEISEADMHYQVEIAEGDDFDR